RLAGLGPQEEDGPAVGGWSGLYRPAEHEAPRFGMTTQVTTVQGNVLGAFPRRPGGAGRENQGPQQRQENEVSHNKDCIRREPGRQAARGSGKSPRRAGRRLSVGSLPV